MNGEKILKNLEDYIDDINSTNKILREKLNNYNKDEEIAKLLKENERLRMNSLHILTEKEEMEYKEFREEHYRNCKGNTKFILVPTGIGTSVSVCCTKCNKKEDITDCSNW